MNDFGIHRLSVDDCLTLVQEIWDSISNGPDSLPVLESQKRLIDQRVTELVADSENVRTWEEIKLHVRRER